MASKRKKVRKPKSGRRPMRTGGADPKTMGKKVKSEMLRVDGDFAVAVRDLAMANGITVTEVTRNIYNDFVSKIYD